MIQIQGVLEIDEERGVVYFHSTDTGHTALRICSLPKPVRNPSTYGVCLDITHMHGCNWSGKKEVQNDTKSVSSNLRSHGSDTCSTGVHNESSE